jgi:fructokinase
MLAGIELGGTKVVVALAERRDTPLRARVSLPTGGNPAELMSKVVAWLTEHAAQHGAISAIGVASFGPVDLQRTSATYGFITSTPKPGWAHANILAPLSAAFPGRPIGFDTDVNAACLAEVAMGAAQHTTCALYITMGTGIGGGVVVNGAPLHGLVHPEIGHIRVTPSDGFAGHCRYHGACWEGLCSGPAIAARTGMPAEQLAADHPVWQLIARETGAALASLICTLSPQRIVLGGSVSKGGNLGPDAFLTLVREAARASLNHYIVSPLLTEHGVASYIVPAGLGDDAGVRGALVLADHAVREAL